jgi:hypothetical protein
MALLDLARGLVFVVAALSSLVGLPHLRAEDDRRDDPTHFRFVPEATTILT